MSDHADTLRNDAEGACDHAAAFAQEDLSPPGSRLPLYLLGQDSLTVDIDGPALLVKGRLRAPGRFPLQRLSRIVAGPKVQWLTHALLACLEQGIPVIFVDGRGAPTGYLHAINERPSRLDECLRELLDRPDWQEHYEDWRRAARMRVLEGWRTQRHRSGLPVPNAEYQRLLREEVYRFKPAMVAANIYHAALIALIASLLKNASLAPRYWGLDGQALELQRDIADVLALSLRLEMGDLGAALDGQAPAMLIAFHHLAPRLEHHAQLLLGRLHHCLKERLEEWR